MPRFFFDIDDGERQVCDRTGVDVAALASVETEAEALLMTLGEAEILNGRPRVFTVTVRDGNDLVVYRGNLTLEIVHRDQRSRD